MTVTDRRTIGLSPENRRVLADMIDPPRRWFTSEQGGQHDAAKFALACALNRGLTEGQVEGAETVWNVGTFDPEGELRTMLSALIPGLVTPFRTVEYLVNAGLGLIGEELASDPDIDFPELMDKFGGSQDTGSGVCQ